jgi:hypothetical protein
VISPQRILAAGRPYGFVIYDLPDLPVSWTENESAIPIRPIWRYEGKSGRYEDSYFQSSPVFYEHPGSLTPLIYILDKDGYLHLFKFSESNIIEELQACYLGSYATASTVKIGFLRGIGINDGTTRGESKLEEDEEEEAVDDGKEHVLADPFLLPPSHEIGMEREDPTWLIPFGEHDRTYTRDISIDDRTGRVAILIHDFSNDVRHILLIDPVAMS